MELELLSILKLLYICNDFERVPPLKRRAFERKVEKHNLMILLSSISTKYTSCLDFYLFSLLFYHVLEHLSNDPRRLLGVPLLLLGLEIDKGNPESIRVSSRPFYKPLVY